MGTYIGHCHNCNVTLEAESLALDLLDRYSAQTAIEILELAIKTEVPNAVRVAERALKDQG